MSETTEYEYFFVGNYCGALEAISSSIRCMYGARRPRKCLSWALREVQVCLELGVWALVLSRVYRVCIVCTVVGAKRVGGRQATCRVSRGGTSSNAAFVFCTAVRHGYRPTVGAGSSSDDTASVTRTCDS